MSVPEDRLDVQDSVPARVVSWHDSLWLVSHGPIFCHTREACLVQLAPEGTGDNYECGLSTTQPMIRRGQPRAPRRSRSRKPLQRVNCLSTCSVMGGQDACCILSLCSGFPGSNRPGKLDGPGFYTIMRQRQVTTQQYWEFERGRPSWLTGTGTPSLK